MTNKKVYLIGNSHIDIVWQWQWQEGFSEIKATFKSVLDRMKEFDDFHFTCAGSLYYEWIEQSDLQMFEEIKQRVAEGRWIIAGGWYLQPDCNIPCGEAFVRQALIAQNYFLNKFGKKATVGYNVDSFGHNGALPQILKKSGLDCYVYMRPNNDEKNLKTSLFWWKGNDGSSVLTYRIPNSYCLTHIEDLEGIKHLAENEDLPQMAFYGVGNHGGGPTIQLLEQLKILQDKNSDFKISDISEYFSIVSAYKLPIVEGDLQFHAKGCYSVNTKIKAANRKAEENLIQAEVFACMAKQLLGGEYPKNILQKSWKDLLFCQFHDSLGGCITKPAAEDVLSFYGRIMSNTEEIINLALQRIAWEIDTLDGNSPNIFRKNTFYPFVHEKLGSPVVLFNPLPYAVKKAYQIYPKCMRVTDWNDELIQSQVIRGYQTDSVENKYNTLIYTEVPAFGYKVVKIFKEGESAKLDVVQAGDDYLENKIIKVIFDVQTGGIRSIYCKKSKSELLSSSTGVIVCDDSHYDTWAHNIKKFDEVLGSFGQAEMHLIEQGPVRSTMRVTTRYKENCKIVQDYSLYADSDQIEVNVKTFIGEPHKIIRFAFPANVGEEVKILSSMQFGAIERTNDNDEYPCGKWFAVSGKDNGIAIFNDGKYSFSADKNIGYLTALRTSIYLDHYGERDEHCEFMDMDETTFHYCIAPFISISETTKRANIFNCKARSIIGTFHSGRLSQKYEGITVDNENVEVSAFKVAEDNNGYVLRIYELSGQQSKATITVKFMHLTFEVILNPYEIKTLRFLDGKVVENNLIEEELC